MSLDLERKRGQREREKPRAESAEQRGTDVTDVGVRLDGDC